MRRHGRADAQEPSKNACRFPATRRRFRGTVRTGDLDILEAIVAARGGFGHREHLELVWTYLQRYDAEAAHRAVAAAIRHLASAHGAPDKYHETITRCWMHLVMVHRAGSPETSFDAFLAANRGLLDRRLLDAHYTPERLASPEARAGWLAPDRRALPAVPS